MILYRCMNKKGTSITPSNSNPASMTAGETYEPTDNGIAISSLNQITPSNTNIPSLTSGSIYKMNGAGVAIGSYSSISPSNSAPQNLTSGNIYKMDGSGVAIQSYSNLMPSSSAPNIYTNNLYKATSDGYAINAYSSVTPSSTGTYFNSGFNKMLADGYAYSEQPKFISGTYDTSNLTLNEESWYIPLGFSPTYFAIWLFAGGSSGTTGFACLYNSVYAPRKYLWLTRGAQAGAIVDFSAATTVNRMYSINSIGTVTMNPVNTNGVGLWYYFAIG